MREAILGATIRAAIANMCVWKMKRSGVSKKRGESGSELQSYGKCVRKKERKG